MGPSVDSELRPRAPTGIAGLDKILYGGLPSERIYLIDGGPGTGKTTLGFQFLLEGVARGESVLYASLLQTRDELKDVAASHGWSLEGISLLELPAQMQESMESHQTVFSPAEVEVDEITDAIMEKIREIRPTRTVIDSISELTVVVERPHQLQRQLIKLKRALLDVHCTALLIAGESVVRQQPTSRTVVHGVIELGREAPNHGEPRRRLEVKKIRGAKFAGGRHDFVIRKGGLTVFAPLVRSAGANGGGGVIASDCKELDTMFGGGLVRGPTCPLLGPSGVGKSTLTAQYAAAAAERGRFACVYCFDESRETYLHRTRGLKLPVAQHVESGLIDLRHYDVGDLCPGQFMRDLQRDVEERHAELIVLDSLTGFVNLMPGVHHLLVRLHEILHFLNSHGVLTLITVNLHGIYGPGAANVDASYLADALVLMRHFEARGTVRRCISVLKKRYGDHEDTIREVDFGPGGLRVGPPLHDFSGVLTGEPRYEGAADALLEAQEGSDGG